MTAASSKIDILAQQLHLNHNKVHILSFVNRQCTERQTEARGDVLVVDRLVGDHEDAHLHHAALQLSANELQFVWVHSLGLHVSVRNEIKIDVLTLRPREEQPEIGPLRNTIFKVSLE